ncbi:hemolysin family protein [Rurimicrobium arvi]|uniref:Hemolysin family protein n=2 Tax=Rurimicrobium arvi TaxID=2049916 RepID=A0ABP8N380_9BACT
MIAFFAGTEIAFISASKLNIELKRKRGSLTGKILGNFSAHPEEFIGSSLIGVNVFLVIYGLLMTRLTEHWWEALFGFLKKGVSHSAFEYVSLIADTTFATLVILFVAEFLPKIIFKSNSERLLTLFAIPMQLTYWIFYPLAKFFVSVSEFILHYLLNVRIRSGKEVFNRTDLEQFIKQSLHGHQGDSGELNTELFENALELVNIKVRKFMIPRNEVEAVELHTPLSVLRQKFIETQLSKIIVYSGSIDNVLGYVHHLDLHKNPSGIQSVLHSISPVPEAMSAVDLMNQFTRERKSIAWVIDEFGGTAGIATMEDVLEEIFGDINDEYDVEQYVEQQLSSNEYIFSGRLELDYLNAKYGFDFPEDEAETLSGYIIDRHETIPRQNEKILIDNYQFVVLLVSDTRIETVKMIVMD